MSTRRGGNGADEVSDADAARAIERQIQEVQQRVERGGVMEYLKPLGPGGRKDVNKQFLTSTIKSVDSHNRRQEEDKLWKIRELERKLDDRSRHRRDRSMDRSSSPDSRSRGRGCRRERSRSRSRSRDRDRGRRRRSRSHSSGRGRRGRSPRREKEEMTADGAGADNTSDAEREYWAAKKAEKTKKMWENVYAGTTSVLVANAPEFSSEDDSDDSDERVHDSSDDDDDKKPKKHKREKKAKKEMKKKKKKDKKHKSSKAYAAPSRW